jgi:hypothetical protein
MIDLQILESDCTCTRRIRCAAPLAAFQPSSSNRDWSLSGAVGVRGTVRAVLWVSAMLAKMAPAFLFGQWHNRHKADFDEEGKKAGARKEEYEK